MTRAEEPPAAAIEQPTEPLDVDGVAATTYGTALWAVALVVLLLSGVRFADPSGWWLWACIVGFLLGLPGIAFTRRRAAVYRERAERSGKQHAAESD